MSTNDDNWMDAFYEAGCDDAVVMLSFKTKSHFNLFFDREADSYDAAVASACKDIKKTGAVVVSVTKED